MCTSKCNKVTKETILSACLIYAKFKSDMFALSRSNKMLISKKHLSYSTNRDVNVQG